MIIYKKLSGVHRKTHVKYDNKILASQWTKWLNKSSQENFSTNLTVSCNESNMNKTVIGKN